MTASVQDLISQFADQFAAFFQGDISADELQQATGLDAPDLYNCVSEYANNVNYVADTYNLGGDQVVHLPTPPPVPPNSPAAVYEQIVNNYQQNIVNDYSTEVNQIFNNDGDVDINQAVAGAGGIANTGTIDDSLLNTGTQTITDSNVAVGNDGDVSQTGDVTASDGSAVNTGTNGSAETTGSGNDFGEGSQGNVNATSDSTDVNNNANQSDVDISGTGGDGGAGGSADGSLGSAGGAGGEGGDGFHDSPVTVDVDQSNEQDVTHHDAPVDHPPAGGEVPFVG